MTDTSSAPDGPDAGSVEDIRIVKFGTHYYITYAYRPFGPGRYWLNPGKVAGIYLYDFEMTDDLPIFLRKNYTASGLAVTQDFRTYKKLGRITQANIDNRDVILFPEKVNGQYVMVHRPMQWVGEEYGTEHPAMWISYSDDLLTWNNSELLITGQSNWEHIIGGSTPPLRTDEGWLVLYHGVGPDKYYRVGVMLLNIDNPSNVIARSPDFIMEPEEDYEFDGFYPGAIFPVGNVIVDDVLYVYYGAADKHCALATASLPELLEYVKAYPV